MTTPPAPGAVSGPFRPCSGPTTQTGRSTIDRTLQTRGRNAVFRTFSHILPHRTHHVHRLIPLLLLPLHSYASAFIVLYKFILLWYPVRLNFAILVPPHSSVIAAPARFLSVAHLPLLLKLPSLARPSSFSEILTNRTSCASTAIAMSMRPLFLRMNSGAFSVTS